jgi:hypothetical protein
MSIEFARRAPQVSIHKQVRASIDLVTAVSKESFFFLISTTRLCLTPAGKEYFVARQRISRQEAAVNSYLFSNG